MLPMGCLLLIDSGSQLTLYDRLGKDEKATITSRILNIHVIYTHIEIGTVLKDCVFE